MAEAELRGSHADDEAKKVCKQCLKVGLGNWDAMVKKLAQAEKEAKSKQPSAGGWFSWGSGEQKDHIGRWESEEQVVKDRIRRARELLTSDTAKA